MARTARKRSASGYYHIVLRGINKQNLFYDDEDREVFLNRIKLVKETIEYEVVAFCLMTNHVHLLIKEKEKSIGEIIRKILSSYVYWYNSKYERVGHLFQNRYKSEPIENNEYLICCTRYILQNPLKAKICNIITDYKWSSGRLLIEDNKSFVNDEIIKELLNGQLLEFMNSKNEDKFLEWENKVKYTDDKMIMKIEKVLKNKSIYDIMKLDKEEQTKTLSKIMKIEGISIRQAARITGVPISIIRYIE